MMEEYEYYEEDEKPIITLRGFMGEVRRKWYVYLALIVVMAILGAVIAAFIIPRNYSSYATLMIEKEEVTYEPVVNPTGADTEMAIVEFMKNKESLETSLINSKTTIINSIISTASDYYIKTADLYNERYGGKLEWNKLSKYLGFSRNGMIINMRYTATKSGEAKKILGCAIDVLMDYEYKQYGNTIKISDIVSNRGEESEELRSESGWFTYALIFAAAGLVISILAVLLKIFIDREKAAKAEENKDGEKE